MFSDFSLTKISRYAKIKLYQMRQFWRRVMTESDLLILADSPLFRESEKDWILQVLKKAAAYEEIFSAGDPIPLQKGGKNRIGILLSGQAKVFASKENKALLNRLKEGSLFGVSFLFGSAGAGTLILAHKKCRVLFLEEDRSEILWEEKNLRRNLISFLTDRICFLNRKIAVLSEGGAEGKLLRFLSDRADENGLFSLPFSFSELAGALNIGRASLYRAFDKLEEKGLLQKEKKTIRLLSPDDSKLF